MWVFFALWAAHYVNRSLIYPFRTRTRGKTMPFAIALSAMAFNVANGDLNGYYLGWLTDPYPIGWFADPRFIGGVILFVTGAVINIRADSELIALRSGETEYAIPWGGLFEIVSCPNLLGEIVEWSGFALMCWNLPGLSFAIWTAANLIPRAISHHRWYRQHFADYPAQRKAVIPFLL
jgi:steroid 5-alpha reductase family enzyme